MKRSVPLILDTVQATFADFFKIREYRETLPKLGEIPHTDCDSESGSVRCLPKFLKSTFAGGIAAV